MNRSTFLKPLRFLMLLLLLALPLAAPSLAAPQVPAQELRGIPIQLPDRGVRLQPGLLRTDVFEFQPGVVEAADDSARPQIEVERTALTLQTQPAAAWLQGDTARMLNLAEMRVALPADSNVVLALDEPARMERDAEGLHVVLPYLVRHVDARGIVVDLGRPDLRPVRESLAWNAITGRFECTVRVGLTAAGATRNLANPVRFLLSTSADLVQPSELAITRTNEYREVRLADAGSREEVQFGAAPLGLPEGATPPGLLLPIERPVLELSVTPERLLGFGLQTAVVSVRPASAVFAAGAAGPGGAALRIAPSGVLPTARGIQLQLSAARGSLDATALVLAPAGSATALLRTSGLGADTLRASGSPFGVQELELTYRFPILFLASALFGGLIGALVAVRLRLQRGLAPKDLAAAAATGLLAAVAYAAGVNLLGLDLGVGVHESLVFTIAALGAMVGLPALMPGTPQSAGAH